MHAMQHDENDLSPEKRSPPINSAAPLVHTCAMIIRDHDHVIESPEVRKSSLQESDCEYRSQQPGNFFRTLSQDRRIVESAQFFQALGEFPPCRLEQSIEIVDSAEEEDSQDDDESAFEIQAETIPSNPRKIELQQNHSILRIPPFRMLDSKSYLLRKNDGTLSEELIFRGIGENGLEITRRGFQRGNYALLHRKAWLEVSDTKHRYGKNLRLYYRHWSALQYPTNNFFDWLDSRGESFGKSLPDLPECPRSRLDTDTVLYIKDSEVTRSYTLSISRDPVSRRGRILDVDGDPVYTGADGWIFVLRDGILYGSKKITAVSRHSRQRFHHSSFFGGKAVSAAGIIVTDHDGYLIRLYPHSGHYRPGEADTQRCLCYIYSEGVDLQTFEVDMQQIIHVSRQKDPPGVESKEDQKEESKKKEKMCCLYLQNACSAAEYLSHKAECIQKGIFKDINQVLKARESGSHRVSDILLELCKG